MVDFLEQVCILSGYCQINVYCQLKAALTQEEIIGTQRYTVVRTTVHPSPASFLLNVHSSENSANTTDIQQDDVRLEMTPFELKLKKNLKKLCPTSRANQPNQRPKRYQTPVADGR